MIEPGIPCLSLWFHIGCSGNSGHVKIGIIFLFIGKSQLCLYNTQSILIGCSTLSQGYCKLIGLWLKLMRRQLWTLPWLIVVRIINVKAYCTSVIFSYMYCITENMSSTTDPSKLYKFKKAIGEGWVMFNEVLTNFQDWEGPHYSIYGNLWFSRF